MVFSSNGEPAHVSVDVYGILQADSCFLGISFLETVGSFNIVGSSIMLGTLLTNVGINTSLAASLTLTWWLAILVKVFPA